MEPIEGMLAGCVIILAGTVATAIVVGLFFGVLSMMLGAFGIMMGGC